MQAVIEGAERTWRAQDGAIQSALERASKVSLSLAPE
jgi:hypothetical protein